MALEKIETKREGSVYWVLYQPPKRIKLRLLREPTSTRAHSYFQMTTFSASDNITRDALEAPESLLNGSSDQK